MIRAYTAAQIRAAEEVLLAASPPGSLMAAAAFAVAGSASRLLAERRGHVAGARALVLVGPGANGGDALHAGALLARRGVQVTAVATSQTVHAEGLAALRRAGGLVRSVVVGGPGAECRVAEAADLARGSDVIVDGLLGIGGRGGLREITAALVSTILVEASLTAGRRRPGGPLVVAVDLPSGVGVDDGAVTGPVLPADVTVTMGACKPALLLPPGAAVAGRVEVVDLGVQRVLDDDGAAPAVHRLTAQDVRGLWPLPRVTDHKYTRGVLGLVAGSEDYPGAAVMASSAAVKTGVGMVRYLGPEHSAVRVVAAQPEVVPGGRKVQAWALGPGVAPAAEDQLSRITQALRWALADRLPVVVDAGGLRILPDRLAPWIVLTPHAGELSELLAARGVDASRADVEGDPVRWTQLAAQVTGATVLLKGAWTVVAGPASGGSPETVYVQDDGTPWLATAGTGDVLTGVLGALMAGHGPQVGAQSGMPAALAALAALVHGRAAVLAAADHRRHCGENLAGGPISATDVIAALPATITGLLAGG